MPSHTIHEKWAKKLGIPSEISSFVDKIIDGKNPWNIHDLGKDKNRPMHEPIKRGKVTINFPYVKVQTWDLLQYMLEMTFPVRETYMLAVKAALLHHFLDGVCKFLREYGLHYSKKDYTDTDIILNYAVEYASDVYLLDPKTFKLVEKFVDENKVKIIFDIAKELKDKENFEYGPIVVSTLLSEIRKKAKWPGNIHMDGKLYFFAPGVRAIYNKLKRGEIVRFSFAYSGHTRKYKYDVSPIFELKPPIEKAVEKLIQMYNDLKI